VSTYVANGQVQWGLWRQEWLAVEISIAEMFRFAPIWLGWRSRRGVRGEPAERSLGEEREIVVVELELDVEGGQQGQAKGA
jgi:hypothetical protein